MLPSITKPKSAAAEHAHATDRFTRKISPILGVQLALAAADAHAVIRKTSRKWGEIPKKSGFRITMDEADAKEAKNGV